MTGWRIRGLGSLCAILRLLCCGQGEELSSRCYLGSFSSCSSCYTVYINLPADRLFKSQISEFEQHNFLVRIACRLFLLGALSAHKIFDWITDEFDWNPCASALGFHSALFRASVPTRLLRTHEIEIKLFKNWRKKEIERKKTPHSH